MLYMVDLKADIDSANEIDKAEGPGPVFQKIAERFKPKSMWVNPSKRESIMIVELNTASDMSELMHVLTWVAKAEPTFTPLMDPETNDQAIKEAKKIVTPP
jgi:hypothetical protein